MENDHVFQVVVDVGGTRTRVWIQDAAHRLKKKSSFPTDRNSLKKSIQRTLRRRRPRSLLVGLRGVWTPAEKNRWRNKLKSLASKVKVVSDIELAHRLAFGKRSGIVLNAGTGSIAFGRNAAGRTARAGGLGPLIGDEGSAFWMGQEYLKLVYKRGGDVRRLRRFGKGAQAVPRIAGLARIVLKEAGQSPKSECRRIVRRAQIHLRELIQEVKKKLGWKRTAPLYLTGGLFENNDFRKSFLKFIGPSRTSPSRV